MNIVLIIVSIALILGIVSLALDIRNRRALKRWKDERISKKES